jgi:hypothetical protein
MGPRTGQDDMEMREILPLQGFELRPLGGPASSQSLHRLSYPGSPSLKYYFSIFPKEMKKTSARIIGTLAEIQIEYLRIKF